MHVQSRSRLERPSLEILSGHAGQVVQQRRLGMQVNRKALRSQFQG